MFRRLRKYRSEPTNTLDYNINPNLIRWGTSIHKGDLGEVVLCTYEGKNVAVKVLDTKHVTDEMKQTEIRRWFAREVEIMERIKHPNIVTYIGSNVKIGFPYPKVMMLITEYIPNGSLRDWLQRNYLCGRRPDDPLVNLKTIIKVCKELACVIAYMHEMHIVHKDIKPDNILIDINANVKLCDFGLASYIRKGMHKTEGTIRFMAPEILKGNTYDSSIDVYAFGMVIWELLTGDYPHQEYTDKELLKKLIQDSTLRPHIPKSCPLFFSDLMRSCWHEDPKQRPSMKVVSNLLEELYRHLQK